jgi:hypothetical protein
MLFSLSRGKWFTQERVELKRGGLHRILHLPLEAKIAVLSASFGGDVSPPL